MSVGDGYRSYEEFQREELQKDQRLEMTYEELLADFVSDDNKRDRERREGLFDAYGEG